MSSPTLSVRAPVSAAGKAQALAAVDEFGKQNGWPRPIQNEVALILEEWLTNIVSYSKAPASSEMVLELSENRGELVLEIRDAGESFDPTAAAPPDTTTPLEVRRIGGYGIAMIKKLVDEIRWRRLDGQNSLWLRKSIRDPKLRG